MIPAARPITALYLSPCHVLRNQVDFSLDRMVVSAQGTPLDEPSPELRRSIPATTETVGALLRTGSCLGQPALLGIDLGEWARLRRPSASALTRWSALLGVFPRDYVFSL